MDDILTQIRPILMTTPERWKQLTQQWPADLLTLAPAPGEWSAVQCLQHMINFEPAFQARIIAFKEGRDFPPFSPSQGMDRTEFPAPTAMADEFASLREESLRRLLTLTPGDLSLRVRHPELGLVTLEQMLHQVAAHDLNHTMQAEEALMQPLLQGCGPWRRFFANHLVQA